MLVVVAREEGGSLPGASIDVHHATHVQAMRATSQALPRMPKLLLTVTSGPFRSFQQSVIEQEFHNE